MMLNTSFLATAVTLPSAGVTILARLTITDHSCSNKRGLEKLRMQTRPRNATWHVTRYLFKKSTQNITKGLIIAWHAGYSSLINSSWSAPRIETSGRDRSRKSANHGLPAFVRSPRNLNNNGYYRLQKWGAIALARYLAPARGLDPWRRPKGSWALGTRMAFIIVEWSGKLLVNCRK